VHGGMIATAIDDTIGTLLVLLRRPAVTARLEVDYRAPAFLHRAMTLEAHAAPRRGAARGRDDDRRGRALFVEVSLEHFARGGDLPDALKAHWNELPY
jgi:acyl-coenzyme A thioesterase PaaI-like protein